MRRFKTYPIYIVSSILNQEAFSFYGTGSGFPDARTAEITDDANPARGFDNYERHNELWLKYIESKTIGQVLLKSLNPNIKVWLIPRHIGQARTVTFPKGRESLGIRIHLSHNDFTPDIWLSTLFHELVHAMRIGSYRFYANPMSRTSYVTTEEFFAHHMENMFRSSARKRLFKNYVSSDLIGKGDAYRDLIEDAAAISTLKFFLDHEPLTKQLARMKFVDYNPFRDFPVLERMSRSK